MYIHYVFNYSGQHKQPTLQDCESQTSLISVTSVNGDFTSLLISVCDILSNLPNQQVNLEKCKDYCSMNFRVSDKSSVLIFSSENITKIKECANFKQVIEIASEHTSWDELSILTCIAIQYKSVESQQETDKHLALFEGSQIISSTSKQQFSKHFKQFCIIIIMLYMNVTIKEHEEFKAYIFINLETNVSSNVTGGFITLLYGCLLIEWLVTVQLQAVPHMIKSAHQSNYIFIKATFVFMQIGPEVVIQIAFVFIYKQIASYDFLIMVCWYEVYMCSYI